METTRTVCYTGGPVLAGLVADVFRDEGLEVHYEPPFESRGREQMAEAVAVYYFLKGSDAAIKAALGKLRDSLGNRGKVEEIEDGEAGPAGASQG